MGGGIMGTGDRGGPMGVDQAATADIADNAITTGKIAANAVGNTDLRDSAALTVIGRSANSTGDPADIAATAASDAVLRESGSVLGFGTIATAGIANDAVTDTKIRNSGALSVIGRSANSTGDPADIAADNGAGGVLRESGSVLGFGTVAAAGIGASAVTTAKIADNAVTEAKLDTTRVIERQTLGGDAADITIAVDGNADERIVIEGRGRCGANGDITLQVNDNATPVTYGGTLITDGTASNENTYLMTVLDAGDFGFRIEIDTLNMGSSRRAGLCWMWAVRDSDGTRFQVFSMFRWNNTADNITQIKLVGPEADTFKSGFKIITRRRKLAA